MIKEKRDIRNKNIEIDYVENKLDVEDISKKYGIGSYYVNKILTETLKITLRPFRKNKYRERNLLIKDDFLNNNLKLKEIALKHKVSVNTVGGVLKDKFGININEFKKEVTHKLIKLIKKDMDDGILSYQDIKDKYQLTQGKLASLRYLGFVFKKIYFLDKRNEKINKMYNSGVKAKDLTCNSSTTCLKTVHGVYGIIKKNRYKDIKRGEKGLFINDKVVKIILDNYKTKTVKEILLILNKKKLKTATGKDFKLYHVVNNIQKLRNLKKINYKKL